MVSCSPSSVSQSASSQRSLTAPAPSSTSSGTFTDSLERLLDTPCCAVASAPDCFPTRRRSSCQASAGADGSHSRQLHKPHSRPTGALPTRLERRHRLLSGRKGKPQRGDAGASLVAFSLGRSAATGCEHQRLSLDDVPHTNDDQRLLSVYSTGRSRPCPTSAWMCLDNLCDDNAWNTIRVRPHLPPSAPPNVSVDKLAP